LVHILLNLVEFMEREDVRLPIENRTLGSCAFQVQAYAKSLHYTELEFLEESTPSVVEALIRVNTKLQQHDAAWGILSVAREQYDISKHGEWFERVGRWQEALDAYDTTEKQGPTFDVAVGRMRCLHALCEWDQLDDLVNEYWPTAGHEEHKIIAPFAATAAWSMRQWDLMEKYSGIMPNDSSDRHFYRAVIFVHRNQFTKARRQILEARDLLDPALTRVMDEDPSRAYKYVFIFHHHE
jgi:serine/threonine-protein kinase mTOR